MVRRPTGRTNPHLIILPAAPALSFIGDDLRPVALIVCWAMVVAVVLLPLRSRPRLPRSDWLAVMTGPPEHTGSVRVHVPDDAGAPLDVVWPDALPAFHDVQGLVLETAQLDDLARVILDAGRRPVRRTWHGVLVHGDAGSGRTMLVRALAGEHEVPLLSVQARDLVPQRTDSPIATILTRAVEVAPCVVLIIGVDELSADHADADTARHRRAVNDLAWHLRMLSADHPVVVVGTALSVERVSPLLLTPGGFDRQIAVIGPDRAERERIIRRELIFAGATYRGDVTDVVRMSRDMFARQLRDLVAVAVRSARLDHRSDRRGPVTLTLRDMRAGLHQASASPFDPRTVGTELSQRIRRFASEMRDPLASCGLALVGEDGNGKTTIARWLADACRREVMWFTGADVRSLTSRDLEAIIDVACTRAPALVVLDDLDGALDSRATPPIDAKHLAVAVERLLSGQGTSVVLTASDPSSIPRIDDDMIDTCWVARPDFHDRVHIIRHVLADTDLLDTTHEELAAHLHGLNRAAVVDTCHRALRVAAIRTETTLLDQRRTPLVLRFEDLRPPGHDRS